MHALTADLIDRLRDRLDDPEARIEFPPPKPGVTSFAGGRFETVRVALGPAEPSPPERRPEPASLDDIRRAVARLGAPLPDDIRQLYSEVADGSFGPSGGLASLDDMLTHYEALCVEPVGAGGQAWPEYLLPINLSEPGCDCYDLTSGRIVLWDEEALAEGPSDAVWHSSFRPAADTLAEYLEAWLARPSKAERDSDMMRDAALSHLQRSIPVLRAMSAEEREAMGVAGENWEEEMCRRLGVDPEHFSV